MPARDQRSPEAQAYRRLYKSDRWLKLRMRVLVRDRHTCQRCGRIEARPMQMIADHKTPHRGDLALFWDEGNIEAICKPCHDGPKQEEERTGKKNNRIGYRSDVNADGIPTDPSHPWCRS